MRWAWMTWLHLWQIGHERNFALSENYISPCIEFNLPFPLGDEQISAFLDKLDEAFYVASTLEVQWGTLKKVCHELKFPILQKHDIHYKAVKSDCREVKDNKLLVSQELLVQLCETALVLFTGYSACLARAIFISAWGFSMRICEYCNVWKKLTDKFEENHNLRASWVTKLLKLGTPSNSTRFSGKNYQTLPNQSCCPTRF